MATEDYSKSHIQRKTTYQELIASRSQSDNYSGFKPIWLPDYLKKQFGIDTHHVGWPTFIVYGVAIVGSIFGGRIPMLFMIL